MSLSTTKSCQINHQPILMHETQRNIVLLRLNHIMEYDWGSPDPNCLINQLRKQPHQKYAELWMGTHPKGPSRLHPQLTLAQHLQDTPTPTLPFLYKVLCIEKALSIQLHPNKPQAEKLHQEQPNIYDDNEKPEMFLTLSEFQCLFGTIDQSDIQKLFTISPFSQLSSKPSNNIKDIIVELLSFTGEERKQHIQSVLNNIGNVFPERTSLLNRLQKQFPFDEGILVSCLLRYKVIPPGHCYAIAAGIPHAYIKGTCLQIMKNSDNVVRLGLTPKLKDIKTMLEIMNDQKGLDGLAVLKTPKGYLWNNLVLNPVEFSGGKIEIEIDHQSIGIVFEGSLQCKEFQFKAFAGDIFFIQPGKYQLEGQCSITLGGHSFL